MFQYIICLNLYTHRLQTNEGFFSISFSFILSFVFLVYIPVCVFWFLMAHYIYLLYIILLQNSHWLVVEHSSFHPHPHKHGRCPTIQAARQVVWAGEGSMLWFMPIFLSSIPLGEDGQKPDTMRFKFLQTPPPLLHLTPLVEHWMMTFTFDQHL